MIRISRNAVVYWLCLRKCTIWVQLLLWRWTPMIKLCVVISLTRNKLMYSNDLKNFYWSRPSRTSSSIWVFGISLLSIRPSLRFQAQVPCTLYVFCVFGSSIQTYIHGACWNTYKCNLILKFEFGDLEKSRSTGEDLEIVLCGYSV